VNDNFRGLTYLLSNGRFLASIALTALLSLRGGGNRPVENKTATSPEEAAAMLATSYQIWFSMLKTTIRSLQAVWTINVHLRKVFCSTV